MLLAHTECRKDQSIDFPDIKLISCFVACATQSPEGGGFTTPGVTLDSPPTPSQPSPLYLRLVKCDMVI